MIWVAWQLVPNHQEAKILEHDTRSPIQNIFFEKSSWQESFICFCKYNFWHPLRSAVKVTDADPDDLRTSNKFLFLMQTRGENIQTPKRKKNLPRLSVSSTIATDDNKPGDLSVPRTTSSNRWSKGAIYCLFSSAFYLTNCTSDASRSSDICELKGSSRLVADERKIFSEKFPLVIVVLRCLPSRANTERSWGGSACRTMSACLQVFTDPSRRPSPPQHTESVRDVTPAVFRHLTCIYSFWIHVCMRYRVM